MKAAANGVLNLSILDGWWDEAYEKEVGWAIGSGEIYDDEAYQDQVESNALYNLLEREVVPMFYERGADGVPRTWTERMRTSIVRLMPRFNTNRMVKQYVEQYYLVAHDNYSRRCENGLERARALADWLGPVSHLWNQIWVRDVHASKDVEELSVREGLEVTAEVFLGEIKPEWVSVELYFGRLDPDRGIVEPTLVTMQSVETRAPGRYLFAGSLVCQTSGRFGYTVRVLPNHPDLPDRIVPGLITWA